MIRIYDAEFEFNGREHHHLHKFWWIDDRGNKGVWTRDEAYNFVNSNPGTVYVKEGAYTVLVDAYYLTSNPNVRWIQTVADGVRRDNLITLASRHSRGLANN